MGNFSKWSYIYFGRCMSMSVKQLFLKFNFDKSRIPLEIFTAQCIYIPHFVNKHCKMSSTFLMLVEVLLSECKLEYILTIMRVLPLWSTSFNGRNISPVPYPHYRFDKKCQTLPECFIIGFCWLSWKRYLCQNGWSNHSDFRHEASCM